MSSWSGTLSLSFDCVQGDTVLRRQEASLPLAFQKPLYPEGPRHCHGVILHPPGGVANDDKLHVMVDLRDNAQVLLTSPGATKIYRSATHASQRVELCLAEGAYLEWLPQEVIVFNGASWCQHSRIDLASNAHWLGWDIVRFGRTAAGERFSEGHWQSVTEVWRDDKPLWIDRQQLQGGCALLDSQLGLRGEAVIGTLVWIGLAVTRELLEDFRQWWQSQSYQGEMGISRLPEGLVARYRGSSTAEARSCFIAIWQRLRQHAWQRPVCLPRVWNT